MALSIFKFPQFCVEKNGLVADGQFSLLSISRLSFDVFHFSFASSFFPFPPSRQLEAEPLNGDNWGESGWPLSDQSSHTTIGRLFLGPGDTTTS